MISTKTIPAAFVKESSNISLKALKVTRTSHKIRFAATLYNKLIELRVKWLFLFIEVLIRKKNGGGGGSRGG